LRLLVLIGSRATGSEHAGSDWDVGVLGDQGLDLPSVRADLVDRLGTDDVDLVDLSSASAVLRRDAAASGVALVEREPDGFVAFQTEVALFWCDIEPVLREAHADVLRAAAG
jgi:predicted nucleotidyltransferase